MDERDTNQGDTLQVDIASDDIDIQAVRKEQARVCRQHKASRRTSRAVKSKPGKNPMRALPGRRQERSTGRLKRQDRQELRAEMEAPFDGADIFTNCVANFWVDPKELHDCMHTPGQWYFTDDSQWIARAEAQAMQDEPIDTLRSTEELMGADEPQDLLSGWISPVLVQEVLGTPGAKVIAGPR